MDWRQRAAQEERAREEAALLPREPASPRARQVFWGALSILGLTLVAMWLLLPPQVPIHWGAVGLNGLAEPDNWTTRTGAVVLLGIIGAALTFLVLFSRLVLAVPAAINHPQKDRWTASGPRLIRFERLMREDLMLIVGATHLLLAATAVQVIMSANRPDGAMPGWVLWAELGIYLAAIGVIIARMVGSSRYRPFEEPLSA